MAGDRERTTRNPGSTDARLPGAASGERLGEYVIEGKLGQGGMGVVYRAHSAVTGEAVALKTMLRVGPDALRRFKREFRGLQAIHHPHLVRLGELAVHDDVWFFTMEYIDGVDLLTYLRSPVPDTGLEVGPEPDELGMCTTLPSLSDGAKTPPPAFYERVRETFSQIVRGLMTLHDSGQLHRDIKPHNIMVENSGRAVILDFGLVLELAPEHSHSYDAQFAGTPAYMAPEQATSVQVGPSADWYSVGVMLFQVLTGRLPFTGTPLEVIDVKRSAAPPSPRHAAPTCPADLAELCLQLMQPVPEARPVGAAILAHLRAAADGDAGEHRSEEPSSLPARERFVGRRAELNRLWSFYDRVLAGTEPFAVFVHGESGVGKTALMRQFVGELRGAAQRGDVPVEMSAPALARPLVLSGRCFEREWMPYKALDGVIDALVRFMYRLPAVQAAALTPRHGALLTEMFPMLAKIESLATAPRRAVVDPQERRGRAFAALRELCHRLCERYPLVLAIDDMQWTDGDSLELLRELLRPPDAPPLLLLVTRRPGTVPSADLPCETVEMQLAPLGDDDAYLLASQLLNHRAGSTSLAITPEVLIRESGGHPMYMGELVRYIGGNPDGGVGDVRLDSAIWARVTRLDDDVRAALELVTLAYAPVSMESIARAADLPVDQAARVLDELRKRQLVASGHNPLTQVRGSGRYYQPYHDRVRESVSAHLSSAHQRAHHEALSEALMAEAGVAPGLLLHHQRAAGRFAEAAEQAVLAAQAATSALAFERAAEYYVLALELDPEGDTLAVRAQQAEAWRRAGHYSNAVEQYGILAERTEGAERLNHLIARADCFLTNWNVDEGIEVLRSAFHELGARYPRTERWFGIEFLARFATLGWSLRRFKSRPLADIGERDRALLSLYMVAHQGLYAGAPGVARVFMMRALKLAYRLGHEPAFASLANETYWLGVIIGRPESHRVQRLLRGHTERFLERIDDASPAPSEAALLGAYRLHTGPNLFASVSWSGERLDSHFADIEALVATSGEFVATLNMVRQQWAVTLLRAGAWTLLRRRLTDFIADARRRRDAFVDLTLRMYLPAIYMLDDRPGEARVDLAQVYSDMQSLGLRDVSFSIGLILVHCQLYEDRLYTLADNEPRCPSKLPMWTSSVYWWRVHFAWVYGRLLCLRARADRTSGRLSATLRAVRKRVRALEREATDESWMFANLLRAQVAVSQGHKDLAIECLREAINRAESCGLTMYLAASQLRLSELLPEGPESQKIHQQAMSWMTEQGARDPARLANLAISVGAPALLPDQNRG